MMAASAVAMRVVKVRSTMRRRPLDPRSRPTRRTRRLRPPLPIKRAAPELPQLQNLTPGQPPSSTAKSPRKPELAYPTQHRPRPPPQVVANHDDIERAVRSARDPWLTLNAKQPGALGITQAALICAASVHSPTSRPLVAAPMHNSPQYIGTKAHGTHSTPAVWVPTESAAVRA